MAKVIHENNENKSPTNTTAIIQQKNLNKFVTHRPSKSRIKGFLYEKDKLKTYRIWLIMIKIIKRHMITNETHINLMSVSVGHITAFNNEI